MAFLGSSFEFSSLASPGDNLALEPSVFSFNPDKVPRVVFRWTRETRKDQLGPGFSPEGRYVFSSDYDHLLEMYHELESLLEELRKRKKQK